MVVDQESFPQTMTEAFGLSKAQGFMVDRTTADLCAYHLRRLSYTALHSYQHSLHAS